MLTNDDPTWMSLAALAVMAGHAYPVFLKFKGGKAVASFIGAFLYLTPLPSSRGAGGFCDRRGRDAAHLGGSILAAAMFPLGVWMILHPPPAVFLASLIAGGFIVYRHKSNLERLRAGTESVFVWKRR